MIQSDDLLFELGTEELPPTALKRLSEALLSEFGNGLDEAGLAHGALRGYATPRRLAVLVEQCALRQADREQLRKGPAVQAAFDDEGRPTRAAEGFARSCGTTVDQLQRQHSGNGEWLVFQTFEPGRPASELLPGIAEQALNRLPIPKRMRWGDSDAQFVRPVHSLLFLHGSSVVPCRILDAQAGNQTRGHRFHHPEPISVDTPARYAALLREPGRVIADFEERRELIRRQVEAAASSVDGRASIDPELLDEVSGLVEWPVPVVAGFDAEFLEVPQEALILTMKKHQKYFHLVDADGRLLNHFVAISNVDSREPERVREGNERVVRPRLADAKFFWEQDARRSLAQRTESLKSVVFQEKLGSMYDKSERVARLAAHIAGYIGGDPDLARRAGLLSRCDLMTEMVYEFADMQGIMGRYQALRDGEPPELATAMEEFYLPRFSGDRLPATPTGIAIALAERLDTLVGIFGIGQKPTGDKDPFALRRAALGALRILREHRLTLSLRDLIQTAHEGLGKPVEEHDTVDAVHGFMMDRLKGLYHDDGVPGPLFEAVAAVQPADLADFEQRVRAVTGFRDRPEAEALAAANKRIRNILRKTEEHIPERVDPAHLREDAERVLAQAIDAMHDTVQPLLARADYEATLAALAGLREVVDAFFDQVMVMADDTDLRRNRLALLSSLAELFLKVADVSVL